MIILRFIRIGLRWGPSIGRYFTTVNKNGQYKLCKHLNITQDKADLICLKQPYLNKLEEATLENLIEVVNVLGFEKEVLIQHPLMLSTMPITLKFRYKVLAECGFQKITPKHIVSYLPLMKRKTIGELKRMCDIASTLNIEQNLASFLTQWPISLSMVCDENNEATLYNLRLRILQRYLELLLDLTEDEFYRGIRTYPTIRHRPLEYINETLNILQSVVMMPIKKIKTNLYLLHVDPENLKQLIYNFRCIGGIDMKEVLRLHPKLATKKYEVMVQIRNIFQEYDIDDEAQRRCFDIYTLGPDTIRERLEEAKSIPEFQAFKNHPRFLKMIHFKKTAMHRLKQLYNKKQCVSLNVLSGSSAHYETFEKAPGDRLGKGKDLVFCISQYFGELYSCNQIRDMVKRHPYWINVPVVQVQYVCQQLSKKFSFQDIYENCPILLYPWNKIKKMLDIFEAKQHPALCLQINETIDIMKLSKSQQLSLVLYFLEKNHYFTGNGVWNEQKKNTPDMTIFKGLKYDESVHKLFK